MFLLLSTGVHYLTDYWASATCRGQFSVLVNTGGLYVCVSLQPRWVFFCSEAKDLSVPERESITSPWCVVTWMLMWANEQAAIHRKRPGSCFVTLWCSVPSSFYSILQFTQFFLLDASLFLHQHLSHAFPKMLINLSAQVWTCCMQLWAVHIIYHCDIHQ